MKLTNKDDIEAAIAKFEPSNDGAYATCRCLPGKYAQENQQEWAERGTIEGKLAKVYYLFENAEADVEDGADMPFDVEHVTHIEIEEEAPAPTHTPGPWEVDGMTVRPEGYSITIAAVSYSSHPQECEANARLIASAPELLASLEKTVAALEYWFPRWGDPEGAKSEMMQSARAAIAKAKGRIQ